MNVSFLSFEKALAGVPALLSLGHTGAYIESTATDIPWALATSYKAGGLHRMDCCVSGWFHYQKDGIDFQWTFDLEERNANGKSEYRFDLNAIRAVAQWTQGEARKQFIAHVKECAAKVRAKGDEWQQIVLRQYRDAASLEALFTEGM
jgi:hypothetical protein